MSSKKDIIEDLKKFNKDLDKHFPNLDLDSLNSIRNATNRDNNNDEYFSLLANNLMELRTEMALTRKNLSADVEGMVLRTIQEQQTAFFDQIKKFYGVIVMEMKDNFSGHVQMMSEDLNNLKRKYGDVALQTQSINHLVEEMSTDIKKISMTSDDTKERLDNIDVSMKMRIDALYEKMRLIDSELMRMKKIVGENNELLDKKMKYFDSKLKEIRDDEDLKDFALLMTQNSIPTTEADEEKDSVFVKARTPLKDVFDGVDEHDRMESALKSPLRDVFENMQEKKDKERKAKMEEIDKKLQRLSSLRKSIGKPEQ